MKVRSVDVGRVWDCTLLMTGDDLDDALPVLSSRMSAGGCSLAGRRDKVPCLAITAVFQVAHQFSPPEVKTHKFSCTLLYVFITNQNIWISEQPCSNGEPIRHTVLWEGIRTTHKPSESPMGHVPMGTTDVERCV
jgi:hypothetical protein